MALGPLLPQALVSVYRYLRQAENLADDVMSISVVSGWNSIAKSGR
jgi:hypothetical protein